MPPPANKPACGAGMLADMYEQPALLLAAARRRHKFAELSPRLRRAAHIILTGSGSAFHAALAGAALLCRRNFPAQAVAASEFATYTPADLSRTIVIALSQSGGSADVLGAARLGRRRGARLIALTNVPGSALATLAGLNLHLEAGYERAVPATKTVVAMIAALFALAQPQCARALAAAAAAVRDELNQGSARAAARAPLIDAAERVFILGEGLGYACALECALKLKETAQVPAEAYATGEFKHGVTVMVQPGSAALIVRTGDAENESRQATAALRRLGALPINIGSGVAAASGGRPISASLACALRALVQAQMLAFELALRRGFDPDRPPTLQKQVRGWA